MLKKRALYCHINANQSRQGRNYRYGVAYAISSNVFSSRRKRRESFNHQHWSLGAATRQRETRKVHENDSMSRSIGRGSELRDSQLTTAVNILKRPQDSTTTSEDTQEIRCIVSENVSARAFFPQIWTGDNEMTRAAEKIWKRKAEKMKKQTDTWTKWEMCHCGRLLGNGGRRHLWVIFCSVLHLVFWYILHVAEEQNADIMLVLWAGLMWWFLKVSRETSLSLLRQKSEQIQFAFDLFDMLFSLTLSTFSKIALSAYQIVPLEWTAAVI